MEEVKVQATLVDRAKDPAVHHAGLRVIQGQGVIGQVLRRTHQAATEAMLPQARKADVGRHAHRLV